MTNGVKQCPECAKPLNPEYRGQTIVWECPSHHGVGVNIFEAVGYLQHDEIEAIWKAALASPMSKLASPISGKPMAEVTFTADQDTDYDNKGSDSQELTVEVDTENYFAWFSLAELAAMPTMDDVEMPASSASMVGLGQLDEVAAKHEDVFANAGDYAMERDDPEQDSTLGGMLGGVRRRLNLR